MARLSKEETKAYDKQRRQALKEKGLCYNCTQPIDTNTSRCSKCLKERREKAKLRLEKLKELGLCTSCGRNPAVATGTHCTSCRDVTKKRHAELKRQVFDIYGSKCTCCGENNLCFLTIDHIAENGADHRRELFGHPSVGAGGATYRWLRDAGWPSGFQTLCFNCNIGKHMNGGVCPHQI